MFDDTWVHTLTDNVVADVAKGIEAVGASGGAHGWDKTVQPALSVLNMSRLNDTVLSVSVVRMEAYDLLEATLRLGPSTAWIPAWIPCHARLCRSCHLCRTLS